MHSMVDPYLLWINVILIKNTLRSQLHLQDLLKTNKQICWDLREFRAQSGTPISAERDSRDDFIGSPEHPAASAAAAAASTASTRASRRQDENNTLSGHTDSRQVSVQGEATQTGTWRSTASSSPPASFLLRAG